MAADTFQIALRQPSYGAIWCGYHRGRVGVAEARLARLVREMDKIGIWRAAQFVVEHYDDPELLIVQRVDEMVASGDVSGETAWKAILEAVRELLAKPTKH